MTLAVVSWGWLSLGHGGGVLHLHIPRLPRGCAAPPRFESPEDRVPPPTCSEGAHEDCDPGSATGGPGALRNKAVGFARESKGKEVSSRPTRAFSLLLGSSRASPSPPPEVRASNSWAWPGVRGRGAGGGGWGGGGCGQVAPEGIPLLKEASGHSCSGKASPSLQARAGQGRVQEAGGQGGEGLLQLQVSCSAGLCLGSGGEAVPWEKLVGVKWPFSHQPAPHRGATSGCHPGPDPGLQRGLQLGAPGSGGACPRE